MNAKHAGQAAFALALILSLPASVLAQTAPAAQARASERPQESSIISQKSTESLEKDIRVAEDHAYGLFNKLNDDNDYDIRCEKEFRTGTTIGQRVCKPNFLRNSNSRNARSDLADMRGEGAVRTSPVQPELEFRYPQLKEKMQALAAKNPELKKAFADYYLLQEELNKRLAALPRQ